MDSDFNERWMRGWKTAREENTHTAIKPEGERGGRRIVPGSKIPEAV
jgi:hypothetical protein